jgi:hypothetical protein
MDFLVECATIVLPVERRREARATRVSRRRAGLRAGGRPTLERQTTSSYSASWRRCRCIHGYSSPSASPTTATMTRAPAAASTLRSSACAYTARHALVLVPMTATGLLRRHVDLRQIVTEVSQPGVDAGVGRICDEPTAIPKFACHA